MDKHTKSYKGILKTTTLFGGVQIVNIIISVLKSKIIALLLGPTGIGINGLLQSSVSLIQISTGLGLSTSAVKSIAESNGTGDGEHCSVVVSVVNRWMWITGIIGMIVSILLTPFLTKTIFGGDEYLLLMAVLSITFLFQALSTGKTIVFQGLRYLRLLAKYNVIGAILGFVFSLPLYYYLGLRGLILSIVIGSVTYLLLALYFSRNVNIKASKIPFRSALVEGKGMIKMGILIALPGFIVIGTSYVLRIFISNRTGLEDVGIYQAGFTVISTYIAMVFSAMGTDFYPKLSGIIEDGLKTSRVVGEQSEIAMLIIAPLLCIFLSFLPIIVVVLYSSKFISVIGFLQWASLGMIFKTISWAAVFILIAKGDSIVYFLSEVVSNAYFLGLNILGYLWGGLDGIGITFLVSQIFYAIQIYSIVNLRHNYRPSRETLFIFFAHTILVVLVFFIVRILHSPFNWIMGSLISILSLMYSLKLLSDQMHFLSLIREFRHRLKN